MELEAWLRTQRREVAVTFAARAALRVLPVLQIGKRDDYIGDPILPLFRATAASWAAAKYQAHERELADSADAAAAAATAGLAFGAVDTAAFAARAADAATDAAATAAAFGTRVVAIATTVASAANDAAYFADACAAFWSAISIDATLVEEDTATSFIAGSPLWPQPQGQPDQLQSLWQEMKAALLAAGQDWQVWTNWYDDRLDGRINDEKRELANVRIEDALWNQGPAIVNAEIKRRIEEFETPQSSVVQVPLHTLMSAGSASARASMSVAEPTLPVPVENIPSAVSFDWTSRGTIAVITGTQNWPVLLFKGGQQDHANRLDACHVLATDTARSLRSGKWNARSDYAEILEQYVAYLPKQPEEGNFLLADAKARIIRHLFAAEVDILPEPLAIELKVLLEHHIGLRAYYPATEEFYDSVRSGHLETPLPMDAVEGFIQGVRDNTPTVFEPNVADTLQGVAQQVPIITLIDEMPPPSAAQPVPPADPLGEVNPLMEQRFILASGVNVLWKVIKFGPTAYAGYEGWANIVKTLSPDASAILQWLRGYLGM